MFEFLSSPLASLTVVAALTLLALIESTIVPWAPSFVLYAALTLAIPLLADVHSMGSLSSGLVEHAAEVVMYLALCLIWFHAFYVGSDRVLRALQIQVFPETPAPFFQ